VKDSKGIGHVITKGTGIGNNGGFVERITDKEVVVREEYKDFKGTVRYKDIAKKLPSLM
jgi:Tfp pilus assembly protein PilP